MLLAVFFDVTFFSPKTLGLDGLFLFGAWTSSFSSFFPVTPDLQEFLIEYS